MIHTLHKSIRSYNHEFIKSNKELTSWQIKISECWKQMVLMFSTNVPRPKRFTRMARLFLLSFEVLQLPRYFDYCGNLI